MEPKRMKKESTLKVNAKIERHARRRLEERFGIIASNAEWNNFIKYNIENNILPITWLESNDELRKGQWHLKTIYYIYDGARHVVRTFLTKTQVINTYPYAAQIIRNDPE